MTVPQPPSFRWRRLARLLVAATLCAGAGFLIWRQVHPPTAGNGPLQTATVQRGDVEDLVSATGTLQPRDYVDVGAQVSGQLRKIHVEVGTVVRTGTLLAEIDPTVYLANVDARRAQLRNQRATMAERESQRLLAEQQLARQQRLRAEDANTAEALQIAEATLRSARAQVEALKAQIDQTESTLRADEANLNYAKIFAPMDGTVVSITARQGQTLNTNQSAPTLLRIADLSTMTVQTQVSEADVNKLRPGMDVYFSTLGSQGRRWWSRLRKVEPTPTVTNNVVLYNALFDVPNANQALMTQMTAQVFFIAAAARDALVVPAAAVTLSRPERGRRDSNTAASGPTVATGAAAAPRRGTVQVVDAQGKVEERQVTVGVSSRVQMQILEGLSVGEQVVAGLRSAMPAQRPPRRAQAPGPVGPGGGPGAPRGR